MDNTYKNISRFEVIDYRPCIKCNGSGMIVAENYSISGHICDICKGRGSRGRDVIFWDNKIELQLSVQDDGRTLKVFIGDREEELIQEEIPIPKTIYSFEQMQKIISKIIKENNELNK